MRNKDYLVLFSPLKSVRPKIHTIDAICINFKDNRITLTGTFKYVSVTKLRFQWESDWTIELFRFAEPYTIFSRYFCLLFWWENLFAKHRRLFFVFEIMYSYRSNLLETWIYETCERKTIMNGDKLCTHNKITCFSAFRLPSNYERFDVIDTFVV